MSVFAIQTSSVLEKAVSRECGLSWETFDYSWQSHLEMSFKWNSTTLLDLSVVKATNHYRRPTHINVNLLPKKNHFSGFGGDVAKSVNRRTVGLASGYFRSAGSEVIKLFRAQLTWAWFVLLINLILLTIANSFLLNIAEHENLAPDNYENANYCLHLHIY